MKHLKVIILACLLLDSQALAAPAPIMDKIYSLLPPSKATSKAAAQKKLATLTDSQLQTCSAYRGNDGVIRPKIPADYKGEKAVGRVCVYNLCILTCFPNRSFNVRIFLV